MEYLRQFNKKTPECVREECKYLRKINSNLKQTTWGAYTMRIFLSPVFSNFPEYLCIMLLAKDDCGNAKIL
jgi:Na+/H+ antiporter NhaD/arsenite permease-like protein